MRKARAAMTFLALGSAALGGGKASAQVSPLPPMASAGPPPGSIFAQKLVDATPGQLRIFATGAIQLPLQAVRSGAEKASGRPLLIEYGSARGNLRDEILAGQGFDVAILLPDVIDDVRAHGLVEARNYHIARIPIAIGLRGKAADLDVATPAGLKAALLGAKAVKYAPTGAARPTVDKVIATLAVAGAIHDVSATRDAVPLQPGEYEIDLYPISEILQNKQLKNLGLVPPALQVPAAIDVVIGRQARDRAAALAFIRYVQGPAIDRSLEQGGMKKYR